LQTLRRVASSQSLVLRRFSRHCRIFSSSEPQWSCGPGVISI
jgi:hypothetical protein